MKINDDLLSYIRENLKKYESSLLHDKDVDGPYIIKPSKHFNPDLAGPPNVEEYVRPKIIFWDPLNQLHCFKGSIICPHADHAEERVFLKPSFWKDGRTERDMPRQIYGSNGPVLLVSRVYRCSFGH